MSERKIIDHMIEQFLKTYDGKLWMGENFETKIKSINEEQAFIRPLPTMHSVAQLIAHLTAWNNDVLLKIENGIGNLRDGDEQNWPDNECLKQIGLPKLLKDHRESVDQIVQLLRQRDDDFLTTKYLDQDFGSEFDFNFAIEGVLQHFVYHLGQIRIVIKLIKGK